MIASINAPMGMDVAPASFGGFGSQLVVGTTSGVSVVDPGTGTETVLWNAGTPISDVAFTLDGRLIVTRESTGELIELSTAGVPTPFATGLGAPDGIAVHPGTGDIYVTDPNSSTLWRVAPDGSPVSAFATGAAVDGGYFPSPIAFSVDGTALFYGTRENGTTIYRISGFPSVTAPGSPAAIPVNDSLALLALVIGLALIGLLAMRSAAVYRD
ncbi:MAG: hypothetical protein AMXMBFR26_04370 [Porticoccaceae bacterium]